MMSFLIVIGILLGTFWFAIVKPYLKEQDGDHPKDE